MAATQFQLRRGTTSQNDSFTGAPGELTYDTERKRIRIHDGSTAKGFEIPRNNEVVHYSGTETISGNKTLSGTNTFSGANNTFNNHITSTLVTSQWIAGNTGEKSIINSTANAGSFTMLAKMNSTNGRMIHGVYGKDYILCYTPQSVVDSDTSQNPRGNTAPTYQVKLLSEDGTSSFPGIISAETPASTANNKQVATTAFVKTVVGNYAPLASPTFTGTPQSVTPTSATDNSKKIATTAWVNTFVSSYTTPVGAVIAFAASSAPDGWLLCNGQAVSRETYSALFAKIGTTYGAGNGSTTFNVPNYTGAFLRGSGDAGSGHKAANLGSGQDDGIRDIKFNYAPTYYDNKWPRTSWVSGAADYASSSGANTRTQSDDWWSGNGGGLLFDANLQTTGKGQQFTMPGATTVTNPMAGHANADDIRPYNKTVTYIIKY